MIHNYLNRIISTYQNHFTVTNLSSICMPFESQIETERDERQMKRTFLTRLHSAIVLPKTPKLLTSSQQPRSCESHRAQRFSVSTSINFRSNLKIAKHRFQRCTIPAPQTFISRIQLTATPFFFVSPLSDRPPSRF